jgi:hypothetical protein
MKVCIDKDEWYPVYVIEDDERWGLGAPTVSIRQTTLDRWQRTFTEFEKVQREMASKWEAATR